MNRWSQLTLTRRAPNDRLGPVLDFIAHTGLRRGEAIGLRWSDVDWATGTVVIRQQIVQVGSDAVCGCGDVHRGLSFGPPKTASGEARTVHLAGTTVDSLLRHRSSQQAERAAWGSAYRDHELVFAQEDGRPYQPDRVTKRFAKLQRETGLRHVRLHDLRHGQASLLLAAGVPTLAVSKMLGHSSITLTADTYSHLLDGVGRRAPDASAALIPRADRYRTATDEGVVTGEPGAPPPGATGASAGQ